MRLASSQVRSLSTRSEKDFERVISVYQLWKKYKFRFDELTSPQEPAIDISRSDRKHDYYEHISLVPGCPRIALEAPTGFIQKAKTNVKGYMRNAFVRGIGLQDDKDDFIELCNSTFFEILRAMREEDFSKLSEVTLGGNETLQFHRSAAHKLTKVQREALNITQDDLLGDNGHIIRQPYLKYEVGPYIHNIDFTNVDAAGNTYPAAGENQGDKVLCRYKVVIGGVYKFALLRKEMEKETGWDHKIKTPKDYGFKWPRYTIVELDICQWAQNKMPIKLDVNRDIYDFHVFSF
ncbi:hypothetical protein GCK72_009656 [Caenorhabditis remanei]|uniref:Uncharacterized protein n=1 Tax=Caenorhabditis remanei TaxID=31234 RepID=A0A6A5H0T4_CAERE|nr:hypothetical protein GCK72_009656 [Caenorhabditis remanei]KAF1761400.1 hypothetical protein GCK72_009656 [Caenorhabditis remanei]